MIDLSIYNKGEIKVLKMFFFLKNLINHCGKNFKLITL